MGTDIGQPYRLGVAQHQAQEPVLAGDRADRPPLLVGEPVGEELGERAAPVGDAQGRVLRVDEPACRRHDRLQHLADRQMRGHREHRRAHRAQFLPAAVHARTVPARGGRGIARRT
jgi:hypothetical protein